MAPEIQRVVSDANEIMFRPFGQRDISPTALIIGVNRQMEIHYEYRQPMPSREELAALAAREVLIARGVEPNPYTFDD